MKSVREQAKRSAYRKTLDLNDFSPMIVVSHFVKGLWTGAGPSPLALSFLEILLCAPPHPLARQLGSKDLAFHNQ